MARSKKKKNDGSNVKKALIFLVTLASVAFATNYIRENYFDTNVLSGNPHQNQDETVQKVDNEKSTEKETKPVLKITKATVNVYFVKNNKNGQEEIVTVKRPIEKGADKLETSIKMLIAGPDQKEKSKGIFSEIPSTTKLLYIKKKHDSIMINLSGVFSFGGGTGLFMRLKQFINTSVKNAGGKKVYLYVDGERADVIGGDGISLKQPLDINDNFSQ